jgi:hypothetical protein
MCRAAGAEAACAPGDVDRLVSTLERWNHRFQENERRARLERGCDGASVVCLDRLGESGTDKWPERIAAGRRLSVYVVAPAIDTGHISLSAFVGATRVDAPSSAARPVSGEGSSPPNTDCELSSDQRDALRAVAAPIAELGARPGLERLHIPDKSWTDAYWTSAGAGTAAGWTAFADSNPEPPTFVAVGSEFDTAYGDFLNVDFRRTEQTGAGPSIEKHYSVPIDNGRYHLELGFLVPFVYRGSRSIALVPSPGNGDVRVAVQHDWHVTGAVALDYFPLGRARVLGTSFRNCKSRGCWENTLGLQAAAGFGDFLKEWYLGLLFEPVSGLNFGLGASLLQGEFLPSGRAEGMQLPQGTPVGTQSQYMLRPYFGFSLTLDALLTIDRRRPPVGQFF